MVSPDFVGVVHSLSMIGGDGVYSYRLESGGAARWGVDARTGAVSLMEPLGTERRNYQAVFLGWDDGLVTRFTMNVRVETDGQHSQWMYIVGGVSGGRTTRDVWRSLDGVSWDVVTGEPEFARRIRHRVVSFRGSLWVAGGSSNSRDIFHNDVWRSADGRRWERVDTSGESFPARDSHALVVHRGSLWVWVIGGYYQRAGFPEQRFDDVWRSADGSDWEQVTVTTGSSFGGRSSHQVVSYGGSLWVIGGRGADYVWLSEDGSRWERRLDGF